MKSICHPMMVAINVVVVVSMVMVVVYPLMMVVVEMLVVFLNLSGGSRFGKNRFVRLVTRLKGLRSMDQSVKLNVGEALGLFGHPILDNVDILHRPESLEISLQFVLGDILANDDKESKQSFFFI